MCHLRIHSVVLSFFLPAPWAVSRQQWSSLSFVNISDFARSVFQGHTLFLSLSLDFLLASRITFCLFWVNWIADTGDEVLDQLTHHIPNPASVSQVIPYLVFQVPASLLSFSPSCSYLSPVSLILHLSPSLSHISFQSINILHSIFYDPEIKRWFCFHVWLLLFHSYGNISKSFYSALLHLSVNLTPMYIPVSKELM